MICLKSRIAPLCKWGIDSDTTELMLAGFPLLTSSTRARIKVCRIEYVLPDLVPPQDEMYLGCAFQAAMVFLPTFVNFISQVLLQ